MAFQWVFDQATTISIDLKAQVGQTITRNQTVRAVSRGNAIRKFTVELPNGLRWEDIADEIQAIDAAGRHTTESIALSNANYTAWMHNGDISSASYTVICVQLPQWTINPGRIVTWSAPFVFYESTV
tara:strand:- start:2005 stop:2385 length:381 start_codon:yes stop_codon:yes gene_type:complete